MPIDVAMKEPRSNIVREEPDGDFITTITNRHHITDDRVVKVVGKTIGAADYVEIVPVQMNRVLSMGVTRLNFMILELQFDQLTGPPMATPGIVSSTLLFAPRP